MLEKKKKTSSKSHLKIPLGDAHSKDITFCSAKCGALCYRRKFPIGFPYSLADLSPTCKDFKERNSNAHTKTVSKRRP